MRRNTPFSALCLACLLVQVAYANLSVTFNNADEVGVSTTGYAATGNLSVVLNFAPSASDELVIVENSGIVPISGTFSNLAQGDEIILSHGGSPFTFVADYFGGSGNDLVLVRKERRGITWGNGETGQLGEGSVILVKADGLLLSKTVTEVVAGRAHSLALCGDGTLVAWGDNFSGQLGDGTFTSQNEPVLVDQSGILSGKQVTAIAAGSFHSLALCSDGTIASWGDNGSGQLGNGSTSTDQSSPVAIDDQAGVFNGKTVLSISAGDSHSLVLCTDGTLVTWGSNFSGQLGRPEPELSFGIPVPIPVDLTGVLAGKKAVKADAGSFHNLVLTMDGTLVSWGEGGSGRLGNDSSSDRDVPVLVDQSGVLSGKTVQDISAGGSHNLILLTDGSMASWGLNSSGQLGDGTTSTRDTPVLVDQSGAINGLSIASISCGGNHSVAHTTDGGIFAWGDNGEGSVGDGTSEDRMTPVPLETSGPLVGETVVQISAGLEHSLALLQSGRIATWGPRDANALGGGPPALIRTVANNGALAGKTLVEVAAGEDFALGLTADGTVVEWGEGNIIPIAIDQSGVLAGKTVVSISAGLDHRLALSSDGTVAAWGRNNTGQLGDGTEDDSADPVSVDTSGVLSGKTVVAISAGSRFSIALCSDGTLVSWGFNRNGLLGDGTTVSSNEFPVLVDQTGVLAGKSVVQITTGATHSMVLCSDGTLAGWGGSSGSDALGTGTTGGSSLPVLVDQSGVLLGKTVTQVTAGSLHSLALCSDGTLVAWGENGDRQLGDDTTSDRSGPVPVDQSGDLAGIGLAGIAAGEEHSLALAADGSLFGWGNSRDGRIGIEASPFFRAVPTAFDSGPFIDRQRVLAIAAGKDFNVAISIETAGDPYQIAVAAAGLSGDDAEPDAIPFDDGITNLLKFAFNMNLAVPDNRPLQPGGSSGLPSGRVVEDEGTPVWHFEFLRRKDGSVSYAPKKSTTLESGSYLPMTGTVSVDSIDDLWERVTIEEPIDSASLPRCFAIVEVIKP